MIDALKLIPAKLNQVQLQVLVFELVETTLFVRVLQLSECEFSQMI